MYTDIAPSPRRSATRASTRRRGLRRRRSRSPAVTTASTLERWRGPRVGVAGAAAPSFRQSSGMATVGSRVSSAIAAPFLVHRMLMSVVHRTLYETKETGCLNTPSSPKDCEVLRRDHRPRRLRPAGRVRADPRPPRSERRRQDHRGARADHPHPRRRRHGDSRRNRRPRPPRTSPGPHRHDRPEPRGRRDPRGPGEPHPVRPTGRAPDARRPGARRRAARDLRPHRGGSQAGRRLLGRDAPPTRHRRGPDPGARRALPRRADHGPRPPGPQRGLVGGPRGRRRGARPC